MAGHLEDVALMDFAAGGLTAEVRMGIAAHLGGCQRCKDVLASLTESTSPSGKALAVAAPPIERTAAGDPLIGQLLGEYRVLQRLGQGGMGILYRGEQPVIGKAVAIKVMLQSVASDPVLVQRMLGEARAVNAVRHPNIVDIFSFGELPDGRPYMVMELLEGLSLAELLAEKGTLTAAQTMVVLAQAMAALEAAHAEGVIHRDLKPENIFVNPRPEGWSVTVFDFGLAKRQGASDRALTSPGMVMGTPGYMSPEQVRGTGTVTTATDIYAMGVLAWTVLAGREPFVGGSVVEIMHRHLNAPAPALPPGVPAGLDALVMQMLQKDPLARPSATQTRAALAGLMKAPAQRQRRVLVSGSSPTTGARASRGRARALLVTVGVIGTALVGVGWWVNSSGAQSPPPLPRPALPLVATPAPPREVKAAPAPVAPPAPAPVNAASPTKMTWRCAKVTDVGQLHEVLGGNWHIFTMSIDAEPLTLVTAPKTKQGFKDIKQIHRAITACRGKQDVITAAHTQPAPTTWTTLGAFTGVGVEAAALEVGRAP